eukprot:TRINITY_DN35091_c0_g1_i2.p1 TRINITY_DN35091_c0_g1~~TRINITY_DN35091_c0_g1_i2.p1  ORF type:complete len:141 (+),score=40.78 TRINITY_DN35091_c0_g1_i2:91-513(+)
MNAPTAVMAAEELLGGAFLRLDTGDPDGALMCALQALRLSAGPDAAAAAAHQAARQASAAQVCEEILSRGGILSDRGRGGVLKKALEDGSCVICTCCGALVAESRAEAHRTLWCAGLGEDVAEDFDSDGDKPSTDEMEVD